MAWDIDYSDTAKKQLKGIDRQIAGRILDYMVEKVGEADNPRSLGKALRGPLGDFWRYRVGDHRIICDIQDKNIVILVLQIANRKGVYRRK